MQSEHLETTVNAPNESARISVSLMAWDAAHLVRAKEKDRFVRAEWGKILGWWPGAYPFITG